MSGRHAAPSPDEVGLLDDASGPQPAPVLRVVAGDPTPDELAAVTALLAVVEARRAGSSSVAPARPSASAWVRSTRAPRPAIVAGDGRWRGFSG